MYRFRVDLVAVGMVILTIAGCGSSEDQPAERDGAAEPVVVETIAEQGTEPVVVETIAEQAPDHAPWATAVTLASNDPPWQDMDGILVSKPFTATGEVRIVLNMSDAAATDGVIGVIIPADKANNVQELLSALRDGVTVVMIGAAPEQVISNLDGTYVFVNSVPVPKPWSLDLQTRP